jgi:hypothetical protein
MIGVMLGFASRNGVASVDNLTIKSWNTGTSSFDVVEHVDRFDIDGSNRSSVDPAQRSSKMRRNRPFLIFLFGTIVTAFSGSAAAHLHPAMGRFMQRDPIGYVDGTDLTEYVRSNPVSSSDSTGLILTCPNQPPAPNDLRWCRDWGNPFHPGQTCYREIVAFPQISGQHCCYNAQGQLMPPPTPDRVGPATGRDRNGYCRFDGARLVFHFLFDVLPALF